MLNEIILNPHIWDVLNLIFLVLGCLKLSALSIINTLASAGLYSALFCFIIEKEIRIVGLAYIFSLFMESFWEMLMLCF